MAHHKINKMVVLQTIHQQQRKKKEEFMKTHVMRIFTDASYINQSQIGSISYVVTIDNKEIKRFSEPYHQKANIFFLECLAISKAITNTLKEYPSANIEIYTDSIPAISFWTEPQKKYSKYAHLPKLAYEKLTNYNISYNHVRAHQKQGESVFGDFNRIADKLAKESSHNALKKRIRKQTRLKNKYNKQDNPIIP
jgi:ribonuclease HI